MLILAADGITSLTVRPIHFVFISGIITFLSGILLLTYFFYRYFNGKYIDHYISNLSILILLGGNQLISIGIIGEYIGKIYLEVKKRPRYIISDRTNSSKEAETQSDNQENNNFEEKIYNYEKKE